MATMTQDIERAGGGELPFSQNRPRQCSVMGMDTDKVARGLGWFSIALGAAELIVPRAIARICGSRNHSALIRAYGAREMVAGIGLLTTGRPAGWLWARFAGDMVDLGSLGAVAGSPENDRGRAAFAIANVAAVTVLDFLCAEQHTRSDTRFAARAEASMIINRSPEECYHFWRNFENFPRFMRYLSSVRSTDDRRSHWVMQLPEGPRFEWDAEIDDDAPNERISWRSLPGSTVSHSGSVEFEPAPGGRGTIVRVQIDYGNLAHAMGAAAATLLGRDPEQIVRKEMRRFKQVIEVGEVITTEGQSAGRRSGATWMDRIAR
jgi:uncharacterized membrane protein